MANSSICKIVGVASLSLAGFLSRDRHHVSNCDEWKPNWDSFDDEPKSKGTNHFVLVRNAQTHKFPGIPLNSPTDCLTDLGREQATQLGAHLTKFFVGNCKFSLDRIVTSPMGGDRETAEFVFGAMREGMCGGRGVPGKWRDYYVDGFEEVEQDDKIIETLPTRVPRNPDTCKKGFYVENRRTLDKALKKYFKRPSPKVDYDRVTLMFAHSNVIRYLVCKLLQIPESHWTRFNPPNCSMTWISVDGNGHVRCTSFGDDAFITSSAASDS